MPVNSEHPLYIEFRPDWEVMRDTYGGERIVKERDEIYLPATSGQRQDGFAANQPGRLAYDAYKARAKFPDSVRIAVEAMIGVMHHKPPVIELPPKMEPLMEAATLHSEGLEILLRRINEHQLVSGRVGLMLDIPDGSPVGTLPYIAMYDALSILNWDDGRREELVAQNLNLVILNETEFERRSGIDFEWELEDKFRVLILGDPDENEPKGGGVYRQAVFRETSATFNEALLVEPRVAGRTLDKIPFVFINASDVVPQPDNPPLLSLARLALTMYRGEADYRQALFMQGQDTLVVTGHNDPEATFRTGANASITLPMGGTAEFIGVNSEGISEMRSALENDKAEAAQMGMQLLDTVGRAKESGDALKIRVSARTASLNQIALAGAFGLQSILRTMAEWMGLRSEDVVVTPNLDFTDIQLDGKTLVEWMTAKQLGAPLSLESIHDQMRERDLTKMEFDEEMQKLEEERAEFGEDDEGNDGNGPVDDDEEEQDPDDQGDE